jgi:hypothetical protein
LGRARPVDWQKLRIDVAQSDDTFHARGGTILRTRSSRARVGKGHDVRSGGLLPCVCFAVTWADPVIALTVQMERQTGLFRRPICCARDGKIKARTASPQ